MFSIAPHLSDLTGLVSIQGCQSRSVRDTAAFVDACRGPAPGEFMPFWTPPAPYTEMIKRDPGRLRIALSHQWGEYRATPHIVAELERIGKFLESLGHHVDHALPAIDYRTAFEAQTTCYISNFAQVIGNMLAARGLERPPADLVEPVNIRIWEARPAHELCRAGAHAGRVQYDLARLWRVLRTMGHHPDADHGAADAEGRHHRISDDQRQSVGAGLVRQSLAQFCLTPLANLCGIPAISLPLAAHENGLPLGIQAIAKQANDGLLLQLAAQIERAINSKWNAGRTPGVHVTSG